MDLTFLLARGFDFVLTLGVTTPLITSFMNVDSGGSFWGVSCNMLKSMEFGILVGFLLSSRRFDGVYQD